jgi:hypothetical protein
MSPESRNAPEQEISIKARAHEVFAEQPRPETRKSSRPFPVILRETPAEPLSALTKAVLWIVGVIVAVLFLAAIWRVTTRHGPKRQIEAAAPVEKSAMSAIPPMAEPVRHRPDEPGVLIASIRAGCDSRGRGAIR